MPGRTLCGLCLLCENRSLCCIWAQVTKSAEQNPFAQQHPLRALAFLAQSEPHPKEVHKTQTVSLWQPSARADEGGTARADNFF